MPSHNAAIARQNLSLQQPQLRGECGETLARDLRHAIISGIGDDVEQFLDTVSANRRNDAELGEVGADWRPSMRFVPIKNAEQQAALMLHRTRDLLIRQRTQLINAMRAHLAELGLVAPKGREGLQQLLHAVAQAEEEQLPSDAGLACETLAVQLQAVQHRIDTLEKRIHQAHRANPTSKRLDAIPGFGVIVSSAVAATMTDPKAFKTGREFAAWIGLVPRQNSTGGKERLGSISKQGDRYLRRLLIVGALAVIKSARTRPDKYPWVVALLGRRPAKVVAVALANKMARIAWAILAKGETYRTPTHTSSGAIVAGA